MRWNNLQFLVYRRAKTCPEAVFPPPGASFFRAGYWCIRRAGARTFSMPWSHLLCHCGDIGVGVQDDPGDVAPSIPDIVLMSPVLKGPCCKGTPEVTESSCPLSLWRSICRMPSGEVGLLVSVERHSEGADDFFSSTFSGFGWYSPSTAGCQNASRIHRSL